ncbi:MAG TPA: signal peptide peptidase SppA [Candidatus Limnocylindrales bacterium]|nr:signal peptide peptidase SppA [Candidatus Limnocylindrales bacterium]
MGIKVYFSWLNPLRLIGPTRRMARNRWRWHYHDLEYILIRLPSAFPALPEDRSWLQERIFGPAPLSLWELEDMFDQIAADPRTKGIVLDIETLEMALADLQNLRAMIGRFRARGKRVIVFAPGLGTPEYYVASAADEILMQPTSELSVTGLSASAFFLKDALALVGVELDVIAISPFKDAYDQLSRADISPEGRAQIEWLLDSRYQQIVQGISEGRGMTPEAVRAMIDSAPHVDQAALAAGYVDGLLMEDDLPAHLGVERLTEWEEADRRLLIPKPPRRSDNYIAVIRIEGLIMSGESERNPADLPLPISVPILGEAHAGSATIQEHARQILRDDSVAAVVLYIDSPGGSVVASEAMGAALERIAKTRPVIAYMNNVAASGGYWVALPAQHIIAQPGTITGSIGVISAKPVATGLRDVLHITPATFKRGANADIYDVTTPFSEAQRAHMHAAVKHAYEQFITGVARARKMEPAAVDAVGGGRVWTGEQALAHGLIDELGDFRAALAKARALAHLPEHTEAFFVEPRKHPLPPEVLEQANPAAALGRTLKTVRSLTNGRAQAILPVWLR